METQSIPVPNDYSTVQLPDGSEMHFPAGMDPQVMHQEATKHLGEKYGTTWFIAGHPAKMSPDNSRKLIFDTDNPNIMIGNYGADANDEYIAEGIKRSYAPNQPVPPAVGQPEREPTILNRVASFLRPMTLAPAVALGQNVAEAAGGGMLGAGAGLIAGAGSYIGLDRALQQIEGSEPSMASSAVNALVTELGGKILDKGVGAVKAWILSKSDPAAVLGQIYKLQPSLSAYLKARTGKTNAAKIIEDIFAGGEKDIATQRSAQLGQNIGIQNAAATAGRSQEDIMSPITMSGKLGEQLETRRAQLTDIGGQEAQKAIGIASKAKLDVPIQVAPTSLTVPPNETSPVTMMAPKIKQTQPPAGAITPQGYPFPKPIIQPNTGQVIGYTREIEGPIPIDNTLAKAQDFLLNTQKRYGDITSNLDRVPQRLRPVVNAAQNMIKVADAQIDQDTGQIMNSSPVAFEDAWQFKKDLMDDYGEDPRATAFSQSLNNDIEKGITGWTKYGATPKEAVTALKSWKNSKAIVGMRNELYDKNGLSTLIDGNKSGVPFLDDLLNNPNKLQAALTAGEIKIPGYGRTVKSMNVRNDLQGYQLGQWANDPAKALTELTDSNNLDKLRNLFTNTQLNNAKDFYKGLAYTQERRMMSGNLGTKFIWPVRAGIALAPSLITGHMTGSALGYGLPLTGVILGGSALGRIFTNPDLAKNLAAIAYGSARGSDMFTSRLIAGALKGTGAALTLQFSDGTEQKATVDGKGDLVPVGQ